MQASFPPYADEEQRTLCVGCTTPNFCGRNYCVSKERQKANSAATPAPQRAVLPHDSAERKTYPLMSGLFDYFPSALIRVARHSHEGNQKHNPGQPTHWARGKSDDHLDAAMRHLVERDLVGAAWRVLAALQLQEEAEGAPIAPGARLPNAV